MRPWLDPAEGIWALVKRALGHLAAADLSEITSAVKRVDALTGHVRSFATMLTERQGERPPRLARRRPAGRPAQPPHPPAGIDRDRDDVITGLTLPWSSGVVNGHVNRIKMLKRGASKRCARGGNPGGKDEQ
ncbi:hypothetical protein ABT328_02135 [Streptomyces fumanus]|uniref:transposase n=1 Tax=Streptomyces fumanus TaxID=67302 RepID=UPI00167D217C|nr:transposase [Streptomyces fumanus]